MRLSISKRDMSALIAAFKQLSMLRKGLLGESVLSLGFGGPALRHTRRSPPRRDPNVSSPVRGSCRNAQHSFRQQLLRKTHASQLMSDITMVTVKCRHT